MLHGPRRPAGQCDFRGRRSVVLSHIESDLLADNILKALMAVRPSEPEPQHTCQCMARQWQHMLISAYTHYDLRPSSLPAGADLRIASTVLPADGNCGRGAGGVAAL